MSEIIDISNWIFEDMFVSGSKEKRWYRKPQNNQLVLFKLPVSLTSNTWTIIGESSGEMWSEKIASEIGKIIGTNVHQVEVGSLDVDILSLAYYGLDIHKLITGEIYGALCYSFLNESDESLVEGADMIMDFDQTYDRTKLSGNNEVYSYDLLYRLFTKYNCIEELYKMIVFDTLIGNTDRHQDNFGMIRNEKTNELKFAPLYDNSSCLGRELSHQRISLLIKDKQMFNSYLHGNKSSTLIRWGDKHNNEKINMFRFFKKVFEVNPEITFHLKKIESLSDSRLIKIIMAMHLAQLALLIRTNVWYNEYKH